MKGAAFVYLIALCDDEAEELDKTEQMLGKYKERNPDTDFKIERFRSADGLLYMVREENYIPDLVLMDIYMPKKLGIEAAKELRSMGNSSRLVFLTTSREHALEAFGVDAAQYLVKPISEEALFAALDKIFGEMARERTKYLILRIDGKQQRVPLHEIMYCEAQRKMQCMYLADGTEYLLRMTMAELFGMLSMYEEFVRVGISYILNLEHIDNLNSQEICLSTGRKVYVPRGAYKSLKEQYFQYYCGGGKINGQGPDICMGAAAIWHKARLPMAGRERRAAPQGEPEVVWPDYGSRAGEAGACRGRAN